MLLRCSECMNGLLRLFPSLTADTVSLKVTPASVKVAVQMVLPNQTVAEAIADSLDSTSAPAMLSAAVGAKVQAISAPQLRREVVVPPDPGHLMTMCPERSPFGSSVVFSLPLAISAEGA